ncbi:Transposon Ty3-G Gag-Pol polyprotein [Labeo rohita]|uniref:ribonuclease H n=1 Tax=Labeo rohita TaxID=84645 RepID=A0ABQ8M3K6_LABRO|nr:Transposon Ty3-G Gag-Pol polyprotein [Labeo rohita]
MIFESSSQYGLDLLFGPPAEEKAGSAALEGERELSEADAATKLTTPAAESQSVADAEMAAALQRAAKEIGPLCRLDLDIPTPRPSPPLAVQRRGIRRSPRWRERLRCTCARKTPPPGGAARDSPKAYAASGQAASDLHAMAILQVYQAKVLKDLHEGDPDPELLQELCSVTVYALRATKVTAQALERAMSTMVVQERHLWLNLAEMRDAEKVRFLDAPISQAGLFGETVEEFAQQFSTVKKQTEAIKHILPRRAASASPAPPKQQPPPAPRRGRPPTRAAQAPQPAGPAARPVQRSSSRRKVAPPARPQATKNPHGQPREGGSFDLSGSTLGKGRALDSAPTRLSATWQTATTWSIKEQFPSFLGVTHSTSDPLHNGRKLCSLVRTCGHTPPLFPHVLKQQVRSDDSSSQGNPLLSSHGTNPPGKTASGLWGFSPPATRRFPSHGAPILGTSDVTPLRPLAENFSDWLNLPNPSRWLLRTIRLVLLAKDAIETVPSSEIRKGFYSPYFTVPKKGGGLRPILDLRVLNRALFKLPFKMLTLKHILTFVRAQDWFVAIDLKVFHVSILPRHRPFLRFAFEGPAYQYKVLPFGLSLSPRVFTKVAEAALAPLREMGIRILNYLDDWLILAHSGGSQPPGSVGTSDQLGKEQTLPGAEDLFSRCGTGLGQYVCASLPRAHTVSAEVCEHHTIVSQDTQPLDRHCVPAVRSTLEQVSRCIIVTTDAFKTGWGAVCNGHAASGVWTGPRLHWQINCLELLAVLLALRRFQPLIQGKHVLVRSDNTATVAYINHHGGERSFRMSQLAHHLLLWSQHRLRSLRATHILGEANRVSLGGEWRLHPQSVQLIWDRFGQAQVDLFATPESTHCQLWYGLTEAPLGIDALAHSWPRGRLKYAFPPNLVLGPGAPGISPSLAHSSEEGPPLSGEGHNLAPAPRSLEPPPMFPGHDQEDFRNLSPSVVNTLLQARAPSTRWLYDLKWRIFVNWCSSRGKDPRSCGIESVLSFLQGGLDRHLSASTLKVHVAAISANHDLVGGTSVGKHDLIIKFLRGARRLKPPLPHLIPSWDLAVVLQGLQQDPFEPLQSVELDALSLKTALLTALTSVKRVADLQALSVNSLCLKFGPADSHVVLRPRLGYVPKVPTTPFRDQVLTLQAISSQEDDPNLTLLCPVRALRIYMEGTQPFRRS